LNSTDVARSS